ncbi:MAG: DUF4445 domain-containing protein [Pirellulales bacterium]|nr:DUF4445 domain-containing protein [Pirellulales bacterium]
MPDRQVRVTFQPWGRTVSVLSETTVLEAAARAGLTIDTPCGGMGTCGKCRVQVISGAGEPTEADREIFDDHQLREGWRLACKTAVYGATVVHVPETSLFASTCQILRTASAEATVEILPAVRKVYVELSTPTLADSIPDLRRLEQRTSPIKTDLALLRRLPGVLRQHEFKGTAVLSDHRLIDFEPGDTTSQCYGAAFDIGTTTMVGSLLNLHTGEELALAARLNPQVRFGDDVLSRIKHADSCSDCLDILRRVVVTEIARMIEEMRAEANVQRDHIYTIAFAGNTTMEHLLCGIDTTQLGQVPFVPAHARGLWIPAAEMEIPINRRAMAYVFPVIGGFVGGDTVAGILSTQLASQSGPTLMVDLGTNGEIVLFNDGQIWAASTAAGPAFEGARISYGMRATQGAIEKVAMDDDVQCGVIGNGSPTGICGSGLIDIGAELLRHGMVSPEGRMLASDELPTGLSAALKRRVQHNGNGMIQFLLANGETNATDLPIVLTQRDVRELQLACGAIRAGIKILLKTAGVQSTDLRTVLIAGGFGSFIRRSNAQQIGLLPVDVDHRRIHYVGNVSLAGAKWVVLSTEARKQAEELAAHTRLVQLSMDPDFQDEFVEAMIFPSNRPEVNNATYASKSFLTDDMLTPTKKVI